MTSGAIIPRADLLVWSNVNQEAGILCDSESRYCDLDTDLRYLGLPNIESLLLLDLLVLHRSSTILKFSSRTTVAKSILFSHSNHNKQQCMHSHKFPALSRDLKKSLL